MTSTAIAKERRARLVDVMAEERGLDVLLVYGNAWQNDYLRYATGFRHSRRPGARARPRGDGHVSSVSRQTRWRVERAQVECPGRRGDPRSRSEVGKVDGALDRGVPRPARWHSRIGSSRGGCAARAEPRESQAERPDGADRPAADGQDGVGGRRHPPRRQAGGRRLRGVPQRRAARPRRLRADRRDRGVLRANGVDDNFQIIGVGGPEVRGMAPPRERQESSSAATWSPPSSRRASTATTRKSAARWWWASRMPTSSRRSLLYREAMEAGIAAVRDSITAADIARADNEVFRRYGLGDYVTDEYTRVRGHGMGLFADTKPHILEDVTTRIDAGMTLIVHPNTYHPVVGYMVLGDESDRDRDGQRKPDQDAACPVQCCCLDPDPIQLNRIRV